MTGATTGPAGSRVGATAIRVVRAATCGLAIAFCSLLCAAQAPSAAYPTHAVRVIVPFPPGTATDLAARLVTQRLQAEFGQPFVVDNKPGANGSIGALQVVQAQPDGYTLMVSSNPPLSSNVALLKNMPYAPDKDLTPIAGIGLGALVLMVRRDFPARTLPEFLTYVKARPGKMSVAYGSSSSQVSMSMLSKLSGLEVAMIPYKGIPNAVNDLLAGVVDFTFVDLGNAMTFAKSGELLPLAVTGGKRNSLVPQWPSLAESVPGYDVTAWIAMAGPSKLPPAIVERLSVSITKALTDSNAALKMGAIGVEPMPMSSQDLGMFMRSEIDKWVSLVRDAGIAPE